MKRTIRVTGFDGDTTIDVVAKITTNKSLVSREINRMAGELADGLMRQLIDVPYTSMRLSRMKVK